MNSSVVVILVAYFKRWAHCLVRLHCGITLYDLFGSEMKVRVIGCDSCGKRFYTRSEL